MAKPLVVCVTADVVKILAKFKRIGFFEGEKRGFSRNLNGSWTVDPPSILRNLRIGCRLENPPPLFWTEIWLPQNVSFGDFFMMSIHVLRHRMQSIREIFPGGKLMLSPPPSSPPIFSLEPLEISEIAVKVRGILSRIFVSCEQCWCKIFAQNTTVNPLP